MTTQMKQQLTREGRDILYQHFKNNDIEEGRLSADGISQPHSLRLMFVSSDFCDATRHALKHSTLQITSWEDSESRWEFVELSSRISASALAFMSLVKPRVCHLIIAGSNNLEPEIDDQFVRSHFVGIPKLTITSYDELKPHIHRLIVLMGPKLKSLACTAKYLEPAEDFPLLELNDCELYSNQYNRRVNMDLLLAHKIEKIQLHLVPRVISFLAQNVKLSKNCPVQPALKVLVLNIWRPMYPPLPQWFYKRVPNLKTLIHIMRFTNVYSLRTLERLDMLTRHGKEILQEYTNFEKLIYEVRIMRCRNVDILEQCLELWQQHRFFTSGKFSEDKDALEYNIKYGKDTKVFVMSKGNIKFFVCLYPLS